MKVRLFLVVIIILSAFVVSAFVSVTNATEPATLGASSSFSALSFPNPTAITNMYLPLKPGTKFIYNGTVDGLPEVDVVYVTNQTKVVIGIATVVVRDTVFVSGELEEDTFDWYAQDCSGNVWYFGEYATQYQNGTVVGHEGSWEAGVNGSKPGIVMEANPHVGDIYFQEVAFPVAMDMARVLSLTKSVTVPYGSFHGNVLLTKDFSPLEPGVVEHKYYAPNVGFVKSFVVRGGNEQIQLVAIETDA